MKDISRIINNIKEANNTSSTIHIAYHIASVAHYTQLRANNDPYIVHPLGILKQ